MEIKAMKNWKNARIVCKDETIFGAAKAKDKDRHFIFKISDLSFKEEVRIAKQLEKHMPALTKITIKRNESGWELKAYLFGMPCHMEGETIVAPEGMPFHIPEKHR